MEIENKHCPRCDKVIGIDGFYKDRKSRDGLQNWCKACDLDYRRTKTGLSSDCKIKNAEVRSSSLEVKTLSQTDAAYIAGFFDGEGSISLIKHHTGDNRRTPTYTVSVRISQNDRRVLDWIFETVGHGCISAHNGGTSWLWSFRNSRVRDFLKQIYPYLKVKKLQCEIALKFLETVKYGYRNGLTPGVVLERENLRNEVMAANRLFKHYA